MESFVKKIILGKTNPESHRYFIRFGKGNYGRRFLFSFNKSKKVKIKGSFELANDFVQFVKELKHVSYSGKILTKEKIPGKEAKKKAGVFLYEVENINIEEYPNAYYYLLNVEDSEIVLKIKKALPKPGKDEGKIDDSFCVLELDLKYWTKAKDAFFWDVPEGKKASVEHELQITEIVAPSGEKDPAKIRELGKRKGKIVRKIIVDDRESSKAYDLEA